VGLLAIGSILGLAAPASASQPVPYDDFAAHGSVGLCDKAGHPVRSGSIHDKPFAWLAVSSMPAPAGYGGAGRKATLFIYQPRPHTYAPQWSGDQMTSSSPYTNPRFPMAAASRLDFTLADFIHEFPPRWNGLLQLRMYFGIPGKPTSAETYPATDIKVTGSTWRVVRGASVPCTSGSAVPNEPALATHAPTQAPAATAPSGTAARSTSSPSVSLPAPTDTGESSSEATSLAGGGGASGPDQAGPHGIPSILGGAVALLALAGGVAWWATRRSGNPKGAHS
jgi:hypothetical protein